MTTRITLIRHGETDWNAQKRWQGWGDIPLNENGRQQARRAAEALRKIGITRIVASDLSRAYETGTLIGAVLGLSVEKEARLREINVGQWQGLTNEDIQQQHPDSYLNATMLPYGEMQFPGGESRADLQVRAVAALHDLVKQYPYEHILAVTHGGTIRMILQGLLQLSPQVSIHNCSLTRLVYEHHTWREEGIVLHTDLI